jgi:hypothetical protein
MKSSEIWIDIPGYEGLYQISDLGNVKSLNYKRSGKENILAQNLDGNDRLSVKLSKSGNQKKFVISVLIAMAFLNHTPNGICGIVVDHIDNDKHNNKLSNLQLISHRLNCTKDRKGGSSNYIGVGWTKNVKKWRAKICINGKSVHLGLFNTQIEASNAYQNKLNQL